MDTTEYDPFAPGPFAAGVRTIQLHDLTRERLFPTEVWYPAHKSDADRSAPPDEKRDGLAQPGAYPLIVFSHYAGGHRRSASFLCTYLATHGYVVVALDHSEVVAAELSPRDGETQPKRAARIDAVIASRVPDVRFLLDHLLRGASGLEPSGSATDAAPTSAQHNPVAGISLDAQRIGLVGHSFGGWTALATPEVEPRVGAVVAMGAGGSTHPKPGILPLTLTFAWGRDVPTLFLAAEDDVPIPLSAVDELFDRTPASKRMFILRRADHQHFLDDVEREHEAVRAMDFPGEAAWIPAAMRPIEELSSGEQAHTFVRGLTLAHLDASLRKSGAAERFLASDVEAALAVRGVDAIAHRP
jgi:dienelactone hydrolase